MNCLILAAGLGSRLREVSESKPLTPVGGVPLIARVIRSAAEAGATAFTVVTGHRAEQVEAFVATLGASIRSVRAADWTMPNGHSVLAGTAGLEGEYLLTMADHLFEPDMARRLIAAGRDGRGVRLAVDRDLAGPLLDLDDATKVETASGGKIVRIGKTLERYDAIDTGLFLAGPELAGAIRADIDSGGEGSLSSGVQRLADAGEAATLDVTGALWIDVDDPRALALAEDAVRPGRAQG